MSTRINPTVALTLALLFFMVVAGIVSASWGYALGRQALKGITQPDVRPNSGVNASQGSSAPRREGFMLLKEEDILTDVEARIQGDAKPNDARSDAQSNAQTKAVMEVSATNTTATEATTLDNSAQPAASAQFPIASTDENVTLEVRSGYEHDGELVLEVSLQNSGSTTIQFLYSFMEVTDSQGQLMSANTQGLPAELPPTGETFSGVVSIPLGLVNESESISLALSDYPDQQVNLQLPEIPVVR